MLLYYLALTPMLMPIALLVRLRGSRVARVVGSVTLVVGGAALFVLSSRRLWVISIYLCLILAQACGRAVKKRFLVAALVVGVMGTGPLVFAYRVARQQSVGGSPIEEAWHAVTSYASNEEVREQASAANSGNLQVRMGISAILFGVTEHELACGPNLSPSPLEAAVLWVPSFIWPAKNDFAQEIDAKHEFAETARFPPGDMPVCPISEFIFQFGTLFAPLGGLAYGLVARLLNLTQVPAAQRLPRLVAWAGVFIALSYFDGGTLALSGIREPLFLAVLLSGLAAIGGLMLRRGELAVPRQRG
jgi:hypothetical protein